MGKCPLRFFVKTLSLFLSSHVLSFASQTPNLTVKKN